MLGAVEVLSENANLIREAEKEGSALVCDIVDKYGVFWHLAVPADEAIVSDLDL